MPTPTAATWVKFFTNADIPSAAAATYAHVFFENRIQMDMLMDLNKEYLREMGITTMGDIIAILRHAKKVYEQSTRDKVLSVPDAEVPVATISATPASTSASNGKKKEKTGLSRIVSTVTESPKESKPRRVLPEHEGKYKITLPSGSTPRSREILEKKAQEVKSSSTANGSSTVKPGTKRGSIFDRLNNDIDAPPSKSSSKVPPLEISSSIFTRLGDRKVSDNGTTIIRTTSSLSSSSPGILKSNTTTNGTSISVAPTKIPPSQQKVILVKKMPAKAVLPSSDEDELRDYLAFGTGGSGLKSVSFSEEDEVLEIAPRKQPSKPSSVVASSPGARLRFNEQEVSVKQRLGGGAGGGSTTARRVTSLHATKKVVQMKPTPKISPIRSGGRLGLKADARRLPITTRLSLGSQTPAGTSSAKQIVKRVERFSLDSKMTKSARSAPVVGGSVFDRLGYGLLRFGKGFEVLYSATAGLELKELYNHAFIFLGKLASGLFLLADHVVWLSRSGITKGVNTTDWVDRSNRFWLISILFNLCRDVQELYRLVRYYSQSRIRNLRRTLYAVYRENQPLLLDTVKNVCDVFIPLNGLGVVRVSNRTIGLLGAISSIMGLLPLVRPRLKF
uniref:SAM domain-containing protein n=1 Tax=Anopheles farauti TaxID=69004 RepID=A0A182QHI9_9DIPT